MYKKINYGCGTKYKEGYINIDGSNEIRNDLTMNFDKQKLSDFFKKDEIDEILAEHIIEHFFRWEAIEKFNDFYEVLKPNGIFIIEIPNMLNIINSNWSGTQKLMYLYGNQDKPTGNVEMDRSRKLNPQFFCHKYGWTLEELSYELTKIGFETPLKLCNDLNLRLQTKKGVKNV